MTDETARLSQTFARGLQVLECFLTSDADLGITQIAQRLGLAPAIVARLVATCVAMGYLYQDATTRRYRLGVSAYLLGLKAQPQQHLRQQARSTMERLATDSGETVSLNVMDPATLSGICIDSIDSLASIKLTTRIGSVRPLHRGATRKVLLAFAPEDVQRAYVERLGLDAADEAALLVSLSDILRDGYAYSEGELDDGAYAIAAPIRQETGELLGGIAIAGPVYRMDDAAKARWIERVKQDAATVERALRSDGR